MIRRSLAAFAIVIAVGTWYRDAVTSVEVRQN